MNPKTKKFLMLLAAVALVGWIGVNWLLGPPGLSPAYLEQHRAEHDHYIEAIKNDTYKRYVQRPNLFDLEANPELKARVDFVAAYTANEAFQAEQHRIHLYTLFFELFNAGLVVVLVVRLAKAPLLRFLDEQIEALRERISLAARSKKSALGRRAAVEDKLGRIDEEELKVTRSTESRLERALSELAEANHYSLGLQERETAERKKAAEHNAEMALKKRLVEEAVARLVAEARETQSAEGHDTLIRQFTRDLEARS